MNKELTVAKLREIRDFLRRACEPVAPSEDITFYFYKPQTVVLTNKPNSNKLSKP